MTEIGAADRYPDLSEHGQQILEFMKEHPHAPIYRNESGHRLLPEDLPRVRAAEQKALPATIDWSPNAPPAWSAAFVAYCLSNVPFYRRYGSPPKAFTHLPTITREDLAREIPFFVPDEVDIQRLINFRTSGTSGHPLLLASHPAVAAQYLGYHKRALRRFGVELRHGRGQVGVVLLGLQAKCFTYVSVTPTMNESGLAKINLHPNDWRDLADRSKYLEAMRPEVIAGDPISFDALLSIDPSIRPAALISTSMTLMPALRERLESRFGCPVLDVYSMNEAGPIAVLDPRVGAHVLLQHRMYVEILNENDEPVAPGERGEIALTGGFNFCLPLLRYRTGDHASLERRGEDLILIDLEGRPPVKYRTPSGEWLNNIEITHALRPLPLTQFNVHQNEQGQVYLKYIGAAVEIAQVQSALATLFGSDASLSVRRIDAFAGKIVQYTSALPGAQG